jgi:hypothetical protein
MERKDHEVRQAVKETKEILETEVISDRKENEE